MTPANRLARLDAARNHFGDLVAPSPADLGDLKSAFWRAVRSDGLGNRTALTAARVDAAEERYRLKHHPDALKIMVFADEDRGQPLSIYAVFPTGPECVFEAHGERVG